MLMAFIVGTGSTQIEIEVLFTSTVQRSCNSCCSMAQKFEITNATVIQCSSYSNNRHGEVTVSVIHS